MRCELTFRLGRTRHARVRSSGSETLSRNLSLAGYTTDIVPKICKRLPTTKGYEERWGKWSRDALRKAYVMANKLRQEHGLFLLELCGGEALMRKKRGDLIQKAIERHALRL